MRKFFTKVLCGLLILTTFSCSTENAEDSQFFQADLRMSRVDADITNIYETDLYPEGIEYDIRGDRFLISSITRGDIGQVKDGEYTVWISNPEFTSTLGLHIDHTTKRVLITNTNIDGSLAELFAYDLSGNFLFKSDLGILSAGGHLANDVSVDRHGNAYVTDSYGGIIYKVDPKGAAEIFIQDEAFTPPPGAFGLNGIDYHPRGFLIVSRADTNELFKIPLNDPQNFSKIQFSAALYSPDGLYLKNPNELLVVSNDFGGENSRVQTLRTRDGWETATLTDDFLTPGSFLTTVTVKRSTPYVLSAHLDVLLSGGSSDVFSILKVE